MKKRFLAAAMVVLANCYLEPAIGQVHTQFETGTFTDNTVLAQAGNPMQVIYGIDLGSASAVTTANGYTFGSGTSTTNFTYDTTGNYTTFLSGGGTSGDTNFNTILNTGRVGGGTGTLVLKNLAQGVTYRALFLLADTRTGMGTRAFSVGLGAATSPTQSYAFVAGSPSLGGYVVCTFTATAMTQTFKINPATYGYQLNAVLLCCVGANTPFKTIEAETGTLGGGATMVTLPATQPTVHTAALEASGRSYAHLAATNDSVTVTNNTSVTANALVVRASIPDSPTGGGITGTLNLYVDGVYRQAITLTSAYTWVYSSDWTDDVPGAGKNPQRFFDETRAVVQGAAIAPGSTITFKKEAANTASFYDIDCVDLENVGTARTQPANTLSVVDYGAVAGDAVDDSAAFQSCFTAAQAQGKGVWIPAGIFYTNALLNGTNITISGAGMWYTTLFRNPPTNTVNGVRTKLNLSDCTVRDLYIDGNAIGRHIPQGADYGMTMVGTSSWLVERVWVHNTAPAFWNTGTNGTLQNCRSGSSWADGINLGNTTAASGLGTNLTAQNNFIRGNCDDGIALNAQNGLGTSGNMVNTKILNNTSVGGPGANGIGIYGGRGSLIQGNLVCDNADINGMAATTYGANGNPFESGTFQRNVIIRGTGFHGQGSIFVAANANPTFTQNITVDSRGAAVVLSACAATFTNNVFDHPAKQGIWVRPGYTGSALFQNNLLTNLIAGQNAVQNNSPTTFTITSTGNVGF